MTESSKTFVIVQQPGNELTEKLQAEATVNKTNLEAAAYIDWPESDLRTEYRRIYHDFDLAMNNPEKLQGILKILVEKYGLKSADLAALRQP